MRLRTVSVLFVIVLFLVSSMSFQRERPQSALAQSSTRPPPPIEWSKNYYAFSVEQTSDSGYILVGTSLDVRHAFLTKTDAYGNVQWNTTFQKDGRELQGLYGNQTVDGGYFMAGQIKDNLGVANGFLVKTDQNGNVQWNKTYGREGQDRIRSVQQTKDGGYVLAGNSAPLGVNDHDFYLVKTDIQGNVEWNRTYGVSSANEVAESVYQTIDGGYILAGETSFADDGWAVKTDQNGNMMWNKTFGRPSFGDMIYDVQPTADGGYVFAGCSDMNFDAHYPPPGYFWLIKTDANCNVQWASQYGDYLGERAEAWSVRQTADNGFIAAGRDGSNVWLIKTDIGGTIMWNGIYGQGVGRSVIQTSDGGYVVSTGLKLIKIMRANPPVVTFTYSPTNASVQQRILFNASASFDLDEDIVSFVWDFDDGNVSAVSSPIITHRYEIPRTYNVTLTITDSEELNSSLSKEVWIRVPTYIEMSVIDWAFIGFEIGVSGRLYDIFGHYLKNENVTLHWYIGGNTWTPLGWDITNDYGDYAIVWNPLTVTSYTLKVRWSGNQTFHAAENTKTTSIRSIPTRISLGLWSSTSLIGFQVAVGGDLTSDLGAVSNAPVLLSYSVTRGQTWNEITQATTDSDGHYSAVWMPTATGNYLVKAVWTGNSTYPTASKAVSLTVLPFEERNVFSVISNSTVSELSFESTHKELSFIVEGPAGTAGYVDVYVANTLIADIEGVEVKLNGTEIEYTASPSLGDSWLIHFTYQHSIHSVEVNLGFETEVVDGRLPYLLYFIVGAAVIALIVGVAVMKKRRTGLKGKA